MAQRPAWGGAPTPPLTARPPAMDTKRPPRAVRPEHPLTLEPQPSRRRPAHARKRPCEPTLQERPPRPEPSAPPRTHLRGRARPAPVGQPAAATGATPTAKPSSRLLGRRHEEGLGPTQHRKQPGSRPATGSRPHHLTGHRFSPPNGMGLNRWVGATALRRHAPASSSKRTSWPMRR